VAKLPVSRKKSKRALCRGVPDMDGSGQSVSFRLGGCAGLIALVWMAGALSACTSIASRIASDTIESAIVSGRDPELVREGLPGYIMLVDGLIDTHPRNAGLLAAGAQLSALYGTRFVANTERAQQLTGKAVAYGERAVCIVHKPRHFDIFYAYAGSWLGYLQATGNWDAVADLPRIEALLTRLLVLDETYDHGNLHAYLGILNALRPPALGGRPEVAKQHFERAIELSGGRNLATKVEYAQRYARLVFDQELHDRLLKEVAAAPTEAPGLTLFNVLAKEQAHDLLESSAEYF
jgi:hypothetical protein